MPRSDVTYHDLIARNRRNSALLLVGFVLFVAVLVGVLGAALSDGDPATAGVLGGIALIFATMMALFSYYGGASAILNLSGARRIAHADDPELYNVVEEIAIAAGVPAPPVYLIDDTALNAFATGRDPEHAAVAITRGLRDTLSRDELQAVIAHEMSHVRNYDIRLAMLLATLVGVVVLVTDFFLRGMFWGGAGRRGRGRDGGGGAGGAILLVVALLLAIIAPIFAKIIQLAASRQREYLADAGAVELTRNPDAMISALRRLGGDKEVLEAANRATAHLYIVQPIKKFEARAKGLFATHPPLEDRIRRLEQLGA
ncbi:MAG TPA: M48 family metallopeptidase [Acidobacteriota bacterium]|jgi:heat shock protein HtpX